VDHGVRTLIVAIDTTGAVLRVGIALPDGTEAAEAHADAPLGHSEKVLEVLAQALALAGTGLDSVGLIVAGLGPGSYTGTRVGAATALGLARGLAVPVRGVPTLVAVVADAGGGERDAGLPTPRGGWYVGRYAVDPAGWREVVSPRRVEALPSGAAGPAFRASTLARLGSLQDYPVRPIYR
jgi:tRNA threonylcarbamoyladenosine biosynthesis protein TsaB